MKLEVRYSSDHDGVVQYHNIGIGQFFRYGTATYLKVRTISGDSGINLKLAESINFHSHELVFPITGEFIATVRQVP